MVDDLSNLYSELRDLGNKGAFTREDLAWGLVELVTTEGVDSPSVLFPNFVRMFQRVGFFRATEVAVELNGEATRLRSVSFADTRPREDIRLFRVCDPGREQYMHWSATLNKVMRYASNNGDKLTQEFHADSHLFSVLLPPEKVLAILRDDEWIADVSDLEITDHGPIRAVAPIRIEQLGDLPQKPNLPALIDRLGAGYPVILLPEALTLITDQTERLASRACGVRRPQRESVASNTTTGGTVISEQRFERVRAGGRRAERRVLGLVGSRDLGRKK